MDFKPRVSKQHESKPSKFLACLALCIAIVLPYFLVKTFRNKHHHKPLNTQALPSSNSQALPMIEPRQQMQDMTESLQQSMLVPIPLQSQERTNVQKTSATLKSTKKTPVTIAQTSKESEDKWTIITTHEGDTLAGIFQKQGLSAKNLSLVLQDNPHAKKLTSIRPGQKIQFIIRDDVLEKLIFPISPTQSLLIYRDKTNYKSQISSRKTTSNNHFVTATVRGSLYGTAKQMNIPYKLIQQMTAIFNWEIDFSKDVRAGDQFTIVYKAFFIDNKQVGTGEIIAVTYRGRNKTLQAIRHKNANGDADYYTPQGMSLKKAFNRYPLNYSHISSTYSLNRMHPVLHRKRPHKGVDLAAPIGTPIRAVGDGKIEVIGRHSGYGNVIKIAHNKTYRTVYAHMLRFQKGLSQGDRVKRGQVIGYVGQTGLATGPHCHFEFHINKQPKNPTTVNLPHGSPISSRELTSFKASAATLLAQMKLYEEARFAQHDSQRKKSA